MVVPVAPQFDGYAVGVSSIVSVYGRGESGYYWMLALTGFYLEIFV